MGEMDLMVDFIDEEVVSPEEMDLFCFEVETKYKSGRIKREVITARDEESMWKCYDVRHRKQSIIESSVIVDEWLQ